MKLVTFSPSAGPQRAGALVDDDTILDLQASHRADRGREAPALSTVLAIVEGGNAVLDLIRELLESPSTRAGDHTHSLAQVVLAAPIPAPPQMRDFLCFEKHLLQAYKALRTVRASQSEDPAAATAEMEAKGILSITPAWYERPIFYHPNRLNVVGTGADILWPEYSEMMDFELEFGAYIGRTCKDVPKEGARPYIFGYTIYNDFSARDEQTKDMPGQLGPGKGKDFDTSNAMGPFLVTADDIPDPYSLEMIVRVNGKEWARGSTGEMAWKFEDCIAHVSRSETLIPGEFLGSGTVGGGCGLEMMQFLRPDDVVELEVEKIGVLRNRLVRR
jgi:2-keto-4-pentenoate hydratase/2-oxohepta-3-ene-1,7-dioic acid hydratase in catechol pathway